MSSAIDADLEGIYAYQGATVYHSTLALTLHLQRAPASNDIIAYYDSGYKVPIDRVVIKIKAAHTPATLTLKRANAADTADAAAHVRLEDWNKGNAASVKREGGPADPQYRLTFKPPALVDGEVTWNFSEGPPSLKLTVTVKRIP